MKKSVNRKRVFRNKLISFFFLVVVLAGCAHKNQEQKPVQVVTDAVANTSTESNSQAQVRDVASFSPSGSLLSVQEKYEMKCTGAKNKKLNILAQVSIFNNDIQIRNILLQGILEYVGKKKGEFPTSGLVGQVLDERTEKEIYIFSFGHEEFELRLPTSFVDLKKMTAKDKVKALLSSGNEWDSVYATYDLNCQLTKLKKDP